MKLYQVINSRTLDIYADKAKITNTFWERLNGLMFLKKMDEYDGLILSPCNSIHTCFMQFNIDVIFLNKSNEVVAFKRNLGPWRLTPIYIKAVKVIELASNQINDDLEVGDKIEVLCLN